MKFTCEVENGNKVSFLDVSVTRGEDAKTTLFRKKTFSDYKKELIETLLFRAYNICLAYAKLHQEIIYLKSVL